MSLVIVGTVFLSLEFEHICAKREACCRRTPGGVNVAYIAKHKLLVSGRKMSHIRIYINIWLTAVGNVNYVSLNAPRGRFSALGI